MMTMNDLLPYLELHKNLKEEGKETILNHELEEMEKEFVGKEFTVSGTVCELDLNGNELIIAYLSTSPQDQSLIDNKLVSHYYFIFGYAPDLRRLTDKQNFEIDDLVTMTGEIISLHRNSIMRIFLSSVTITNKNYGQGKFVSKKGCFIATAVYENPEAIEIRKFYLIRNHILARSASGRLFIRIYYALSPHFADWVAGRPKTKRFVRKYILDQILFFFYN